MLLLIDKYIPYIHGIFEPYAQVQYLEPEAFTAQSVHNADALIIRTRTFCNEQLLHGSKVQLIATATIGYDHIDTTWCNQHHIAWTNSPGCNAQGVCDYVQAAIHTLRNHTHFLPSTTDTPQPTIGIVGVGHVGTLVANMAERMGFHVLLNDPPKKIGVPLMQIAQQADIITFHTPLTYTNDYPTFHLCNEAFLRACKPHAVIINTARGGIIDEQAALLPEHQHKCFVCDTWENEPRINHQMLNLAQLASYHIAGYTAQGKWNASNQCIHAVCEHFGWTIPALYPQPVSKTLPDNWLEDITHTLKAQPDNFEQLRKNYVLR